MNSVFNCLTDSSSNNIIVSAKIPFCTQRNNKQTIKATRYDWTKRDIRNQCSAFVRNKFNILPETSETQIPNDKYEKFVTAHKEAADFLLYRHWKIQYVIAIHLMRWHTNFYDFRFKWTATAVIGKSLIVTTGEFQKCNLDVRTL